MGRFDTSFAGLSKEEIQRILSELGFENSWPNRTPTQSDIWYHKESGLYYVSNRGKGGALSAEHQAALNAFIQTLPALENVEPQRQVFRFSKGWNTMSHTQNGLLVSVGEAGDSAFMRDFYKLVIFARGMELNLFGDSGDPDDEFDWEFIVQMFAGRTGQGLI